jgi:hypothetical protein
MLTSGTLAVSRVFSVRACMRIYRELCSISVVLGESCPGHAAILPSLANLQRLTINFRRDGLSSQNDRLVAIFSPLHFTIPSLCSLTLTHLPRIDTFLLTCIAGAFPHLRSLELSVIDRLEHTCCWSCLIESSSGAFHSPLPHDYSTPEGLGVAPSSSPFYALTGARSTRSAPPSRRSLRSRASRSASSWRTKKRCMSTRKRTARSKLLYSHTCGTRRR